MKILLTNDDGVGAPGIALLTAFAKTVGEVTVAAPMTEQSAKSQSICLRSPIPVEKTVEEDGTEIYAVGSTPADCVRFGLTALGKEFDLVLSGINRGFNLGNDIAYSGTCAAVFEAAERGVPGIAFSADPAGFPDADTLGKVWKALETIREKSLAACLNVNFPLSPCGLRVTKQGGGYYMDNLVPAGAGLYRADGAFVYKNRGDLTLDTDAVTAGYVSVTPLTVSRTDRDAYLALENVETASGLIL
ncbi:MAG: 5'/3'-nucleotidase SurE [Lachnospiraceae bacterium]|nr:5'/3'-nucleotidase SurE [Lachnospiraceae bacterium]